MHMKGWPIPRGWVPVRGERPQARDKVVMVIVYSVDGPPYAQAIIERTKRAWHVEGVVATCKAWVYLPAAHHAIRLMKWLAITPQGNVGPFNFPRPMDFKAGVQPLFPPGTFVVDWTHGAVGSMMARAS